MKKINKDTFQQTHVLVIGDVMIDRYFNGAINRQSPEADVPIVDINTIEDRLGGAANVALNIKSLGAKASILTICGDDKDAVFLQKRFDEKEIKACLIKDESRPTTIKNRIYNDEQYVLRFDSESAHDIKANIEQKLLLSLSDILTDNSINVAILQDYNKGVFTKSFIEESIKILKKAGAKIAVDPKKDNFFAFQGVDLFKPNLKEVSEAFQTIFSPKSKQQMQMACGSILEKLNAKAVLLTLSENGAVASDKSHFFNCSAHVRDVVDVSGAGDTVIAVASLLLAKEYSLEYICKVSNLAGGLVIEEKGVSLLAMNTLLMNL